MKGTCRRTVRHLRGRWIYNRIFANKRYAYLWRVYFMHIFFIWAVESLLGQNSCVFSKIWSMFTQPQQFVFLDVFGVFERILKGKIFFLA